VVQVIENRADVEGRIVSVRDDQTRPGHRIATMDVIKVRPVDPYPNLFEKAAGTRLELVMPEAAAPKDLPRENVRCRIRRAGPAIVYAESCEAAD
jgi:hypothetical protein